MNKVFRGPGTVLFLNGGKIYGTYQTEFSSGMEL